MWDAPQYQIGDVVAPVGRSRSMLVVDLPDEAHVTCSWPDPPHRPREFTYHVSAVVLLKRAQR